MGRCQPSTCSDGGVRVERAAQTPAAVLSAGRELFLAQGHSATTIGQIAERAGVG
jgi:AcrR family transcriptional regulator